MKSKRYQVEIQTRDSTTWEIVHYTDSLPVPKRHPAARVINQITRQVMAYEGVEWLALVALATTEPASWIGTRLP
jgi:hypothetical protein